MIGTVLLTAALLAANAEPPWAHLRAELRAQQVEHGVPAMALVLLDSGRPVLIETLTHPQRRSAGPGAPFRWGSITKTVTALTLLEAARRHDRPLDTPVHAVLDELPYRNPWQARAPLQIDHLLELAAGLGDLSGAEFDDNTPRPLAEALERHAGGRVMLWPPGLQHSYSNVPPGIAAAVTEALTGDDFEAAARRLVFAPLGMTGATFQPQPELPGGFRADGITPIPYWHVTFRAFGGMNASPAAMARLMEALLNDGRVAGRQAVAAESVTRMYRSRATAGARAGLDIGYGAGLYGWVTDGHLFHGHGGDADGYRSRLGLLRDAGRGYLIGINVDDPDLLRRLQRRIEQALTADLPPPDVPPAAESTPGELERWTGEYYPASVRFGIDRWRQGDLDTAQVSVRADHLVFRHRGRTVELTPLGDGRFRRRDDPAASVVFVTVDGSLFLQGELGNFTRLSPPPCAEYLRHCRRGWSTDRRFGKVGAPTASVHE